MWAASSISTFCLVEPVESRILSCQGINLLTTGRMPSESYIFESKHKNLAKKFVISNNCHNFAAQEPAKPTDSA